MSADVPVKCGVNTRAPLASRLPKPHAADDNTGAPPSTMLHHSLETTYDIHYTPKRIEPGAGMSSYPWAKNKDASVGVQDDSYRGVDGARADDGGVRNDGTVEGGVASNATGSDKSKQWESSARAASRCVQPKQQLDFYSSARKTERDDDDKRGGLVGSTQRAVDIRNKRANDAQMQPAVAEYVQAEKPQLPMVAAQERRLVRRNYLDLVECTHRNPKTEHQYGYDDAPESRLPGADLSQETEVQSKAITHMGTTEDMFRGSAKYLDDKDVGYGGHVPQNDKNLAAIHHGQDARREYAKSFMTLAVHNGGVDSAVGNANIKARHRAGRQAPAAKILKPKSDASIAMTVEGKFLQQPMTETLNREKAMNIRDDAQAARFF